MENLERYRVPVTEALRGHISNLRNGNGELTWRALRDELPGWKWSHSLLADIASGKVASTSLAVYEALGIIHPLFVIAGAGSTIFGDVGLLDVNQISVILVIPPEEWKRHSIECAVCHEPCPRWSSTQRYCEKHSWTTPEGRRYWRKR